MSNKVVGAIKSLIGEGDIMAALRLLEIKQGDIPRESGLYQAELDALLWHAVRMCHSKATKFLLHIGADPNCVNTLGETPIFETIRGGDTKTFFTLMSTGQVDITHKKNGICPVSLAKFMCANTIGAHSMKKRKTILRVLNDLNTVST